MTATLVAALRTEGFDVDVVERRFSRSVDEVGRLSPRKILSALGLTGRLAWALGGRTRPLLVFFLTNRPFSFLVDLLLLEIARLRRAEVVHYVHTTGFAVLARRGRFWAWAVRRALGAARLTVVLGHSLSADVEAFVDPKSIRIIPNAVAAGDLVVSAAPRRSVVFVSNLLPEKGADDFVELAARFSRDVDFLLYGAPGPAGYMAELTTSIAGLTNCDYLGTLPTQEKWRVLSEASALIFPSSYPYEAQPLTIIEAMACGTPVIGYDVGAVRELLEHAPSCVVVRQGGLDDVEGELMRLLGLGPRQKEAQRQLLREYASEHHSTSAYGRAWRRVVEEVLGG